jgi:hypothetical protein
MLIFAKAANRQGRNAMDTFIAKHSDAVIGSLSGLDRLVLRGTLRPLS